MREAFERSGPLSQEAWAALKPLLVSKSFRAGEWLLEGGAVAQWCFFLESGLVREYYSNEAGEEHTRRFLAEGQVTGSLVDLLSQRPSITWIQALEPTETVAWRWAEFDALCRRFPELLEVARRSAEGLYVWKTRREHEMLALSAAERHARWLAEHPSLDARVSRRHLASYLGVTPEHLSRLRAAGRPSRPARAQRRRR